MDKDKKGEVTVVSLETVEYFEKPEAERGLKKSSPEFEGSANAEQCQRAAELRRITENTHKKIDEVFERAWKKRDEIEAEEKAEKEQRITLKGDPYFFIGLLIISVGFLCMWIGAVTGETRVTGAVRDAAAFLGFVFVIAAIWSHERRARKSRPPSQS